MPALTHATLDCLSRDASQSVDLASFGAGRENRTPTKSLENSYSTIKLVPHLFIPESNFLQKLVTDIFLLKNSADPDSLAFARSVSSLLHVFAIQHLLCLASFADELAVTAKGLAAWPQQSGFPFPSLTHQEFGKLLFYWCSSTEPAKGASCVVRPRWRTPQPES